MLSCEPVKLIRLFNSVGELVDPRPLFRREVLVPSHEGIYYLFFFCICLLVQVLECFGHLLRVFCECLKHLRLMLFERFGHFNGTCLPTALDLSSGLNLFWGVHMIIVSWLGLVA